MFAPSLRISVTTMVAPSTLQAPLVSCEVSGLGGCSGQQGQQGPRLQAWIETCLTLRVFPTKCVSSEAS